jgi:hypothetical protein
MASAAGTASSPAQGGWHRLCRLIISVGTKIAVVLVILAPVMLAGSYLVAKLYSY